MLAILINSCDKYSDLWTHFLEHNGNFDIFQKYNVYLNNEQYKIPALTDITYMSDLRGPGCYPMSRWTTHIKTALQSIPEEYIVLFQDDYFLTREINLDELTKVIENMVEYDLYCVHLSNQVRYDRKPRDEYLHQIRNGRYYLNTQIAVWNKDYLIKLLQKETSAWIWELNGHKENLAISKQHFGLVNPIAHYAAIIKDGKLLLPAITHLKPSTREILCDQFLPYKQANMFFEKFKTLRKTLF